MAEAEFDSVASDYTAQHARSIRLSGEGTDFFARYKIAEARKITDRHGIDVRRILDFGAGIGNSLKPMRSLYPNAHITCLDVSEASLDLCQRELTSRAEFICYDGVQVPDSLGPFDLVFSACVFHHIPAELHVPLLDQIRQLLAPGGIFVLFEHNPWNPLTVHAVRNCPFDENAVLIPAPTMRRRFRAAGFATVNLGYKMFFPAALRMMRGLEPILAPLPLGAQYALAAR